MSKSIRIGLSGDEHIIRLEAGLPPWKTDYTPCLWVQGLNDGSDGTQTRTGVAVFDAASALRLLDFLRSSEEELRKIAARTQEMGGTDG
jgi:hypothetical protein